MPWRSASTSQPAMRTLAVEKNGISGAAPSTASAKIAPAAGPSMPKRNLIRRPAGFRAVLLSRSRVTSYGPVRALYSTQLISGMPLTSSKSSSAWQYIKVSPITWPSWLQAMNCLAFPGTNASKLFTPRYDNKRMASGPRTNSSGMWWDWSNRMAALRQARCSSIQLDCSAGTGVPPPALAWGARVSL